MPVRALMRGDMVQVQAMYGGWEERKRRAVFLSFDAEDMEYVEDFRDLARHARVQLTIRDRSLREAVPSRKEEVVEDELLRRIHGCSVCICLIGWNTWQRDWVNWEVSTCAAQGRGILGIRFPHARTARIPGALFRARAEILPWVPYEFEDAIERTARAAGF